MQTQLSQLQFAHTRTIYPKIKIEADTPAFELPAACLLLWRRQFFSKILETTGGGGGREMWPWTEFYFYIVVFFNFAYWRAAA